MLRSLLGLLLFSDAIMAAWSSSLDGSFPPLDPKVDRTFDMNTPLRLAYLALLLEATLLTRPEPMPVIMPEPMSAPTPPTPAL